MNDTITQDEINEMYDYSPVTPERSELHSAARLAVKEAAQQVNELTKGEDSWEIMNFHKALGDAVYWANRHIARYHR